MRSPSRAQPNAVFADEPPRYFAKLDTGDLEKFARTVEPYRQRFRDEVIGRFDDPFLPPDPRSRKVFDEPAYEGWEVVLDVFPDVFAFGILLGIGLKAIHSALRRDGPSEEKSDPTKGVSLVLLSIATSIDALAVGFSFAMLGASIWYPAVIIGLVAAAFTFTGMRIGGRLGSALGWRVEAAGGAVLVLIGFKILIDHVAA